MAPAAQRTALAAVLATLAPAAPRAPDRPVPLLSVPRNGSDNRQYRIELFARFDGTPFDPLVAADAAAALILDTLPPRHDSRDSEPGTPPPARRAAYRTLLVMARSAHDPAATPGAPIDAEADWQALPGDR